MNPRINFVARLIVLFFIFWLLTGFGGPVFSLDYPSPGPDKIGHFWFSFLGAQYIKSQDYSGSRGCAYVLSFGLLKEIIDACQKKFFDGPDMLFNLVGTLAGWVVNLN